jgi:hypothetical protein
MSQRTSANSPTAMADKPVSGNHQAGHELRPSSWHRWGDDDERGAVNLLTPELDLEELAEHLAASERYSFLFVAAPLKITGGVGSPLSPLAIR